MTTPSEGPFLPTSPQVLAEATTDSLSELFSRDPEKLSPDDLQKMVAALRLQRARWLEAQSAGVKPKAKKVVSAAVIAAGTTFEDLLS